MSYSYSFSSSNINVDQLVEEIADEGFSQAEQGVTHASDDLTIVFADELTTGEEATLNAVVVNHSPQTPTPGLDELCLKDGVTAPDAMVGSACIFVDEADGNLKVKFGDGHTVVLASGS